MAVSVYGADNSLYVAKHGGGGNAIITWGINQNKIKYYIHILIMLQFFQSRCVCTQKV